MKPITLAVLVCIGMAAPAHADCTGDVKTMMAAQFTSGPYHMSVDQTSDAGSKRSEADIVPPASFHMISPMEDVLLPAGAWMKKDGTWTQLPVTEAGVLRDQIWESAKAGLGANTDNIFKVECLGPQTIENQTLSAYSFDSVAMSNAGPAVGHIMAYADPKGRPVIMLIDAQAGARKVRMIEHLTYDPAIKIEPPK